MSAVAGDLSGPGRLARLVHSVSTTRHGLIGLSVVRVAIGSVILLDLMIHAADRQVLWGPRGWYDTTRMERDQQLGASLFNLGDSAWLTDVLYLTYGAVALAFLMGWRTRVTTPALLLMVWTFQERNPYLINGGDNLVRIVLLYLVFAQVDAHLVRRRQAPRGAAAPGSARAVWATVAHNAALAACIGQLCVVYLASAMFKIQGEMWQEGTAVYYITRVAEYNAWPEVSHWFAQSAVLVTAATYGTVLLQLSFTFTLLTTWARHLVFVGLAASHVGIGVLMGLPVFSLFMIAIDLLVFTDAEWRRGRARLLHATERLRARLPSRGSAAPPTLHPIPRGAR